ncbi:biosynthetic-type acetolactate synthase large subunit [Clostridium botulinum]|uniref:biosynthetic-type acetolactate synthase large subunit n=1 Tax=Clostridium sp. ZBS18 TaxID=2949967 RepID=UPI001D950790|nr:biosynthetic-type acetolactate synthase large subunit [Clostridium sp. ZBS18]MBN1054452.1 biosynthetic-type acetolactate synthase large subunit [Clostridium botulinum]
MLSVSKIITDKLKENNCKVVFEYPGGNIAPMLDAIKLDGNIDLIVTRNDQAASLMADAYSRTTGEVGVCMATVGPGATNLVTGIANAYYDSIPLIAITGQVGTGSLTGTKETRQIGFQEADIVNIVKPITKWAYMVTKPEEISKVINDAFKIAKAGRPGPVLIDIPMDVQRSVLQEIDILEQVETIKEKNIINMEKINLLVQKINSCSKPVIIAGGGVVLSNSEDELKIVAEKLQMPVANTLMGLGSFDLDDKLALGFMGCYGSRFCNKAIAEADLIIALGNRFDVRSIGTETNKFEQNKFIVHIDIDKAEINNRVKADLAINGDVKEVLKLVINELNKINMDTKKWIDHIAELKAEYNLDKEYNLATEYDRVRPQYIIKEISNLTDGKAIITSDVGQHQMWTAQFYKYRNARTNLTSAGLGNMGYGLPAAIAAKYAKKDMYAVNITGDGSFQMNMQELGTAVQYNLPVKIFIMKNNTLGMVKQFQDKTFLGKATSTIIEYNPDFIKLAEAYGVKGLKITNADEIKSVIKEALDYNGIVIVECCIDSSELAIPEIEGGHYIDDQYPYNN